MQRGTLLSIFAVAALAFAAAGCDSNPTGPSSDFGATLNGQFSQSGRGARTQLTADSTYGAQYALAGSAEVEPVTVVVLEKVDGVKQEITRVPIVGGAFTIRGLPEVFFLRFLDADDQKIGKDMRFGGVKPNQEIDILVTVENGEVVILEESRTGIDHQAGDGVELEGIATVLTDDGDGVSGSLTVGGYGYTVFTQISQTSIRKGNRYLTLEDIDGKQVHVRGIFQDDGNVFAHEIKLQDEEEEDVTAEEGEKVTICHTPPGNPDNAKTISVGADAVDDHLGHGDTLGPCNED